MLGSKRPVRVLAWPATRSLGRVGKRCRKSPVTASFASARPPRSLARCTSWGTVSPWRSRATKSPVSYMPRGLAVRVGDRRHARRCRKSRLSILWERRFSSSTCPTGLFQFLFERSLSRQVSAIRNRLRSWTHLAATGLQPAADRETRGLGHRQAKHARPAAVKPHFDTSFTPCRRTPGPYAGHVVLLRCQDSPLISTASIPRPGIGAAW